MAFEMLQAVVGTALIDSDFRRAILNGSRHSAIARFDLSYAETDAVMSIQAETLEQFAGQLDQWIMKQENRLEALALNLPPLTPFSPRESKTQMASVSLDKESRLGAFVTTPSLGRA